MIILEKFRSNRLLLFICCILATFTSYGQQIQYSYDQPGNLASAGSIRAGPPVISTQPQPQLLESNVPVTLSVISTGTGLSYQWLSNGVPIVGATGDSLVLPNLPFVNSTNFSVIVSNVSGVVTSTPAAIWTDSNGNGIPDWWEMKYFGNLNQTATGDFDGDGVDNLDEYLEGTNPTNAASFDPRLYIQTANGRVVASPDLPYYTMGQSVTLTAIPDPRQMFLGWSGSVTGTVSPITFAMNTNLTVTAGFGLPLAVAVNNSNCVWTTGGAAPWFGQTSVSDSGLGSAQSGVIGGGQESWLQGVFTFSQPMLINFWWNVSCQSPNALTFSINGTTLESISGTSSGWKQMQFILPAGTSTNLWTYTKQFNDSPIGTPFADCGWVEQVTLSPFGTNCVTAPAGLVAWWPADGNALDVAGTNNGTLENGASYGPGMVGEAFQFGGVDSYIQVGNNLALDMTNTVTFEGWILPTGAGSGAGGYGGIIVNKEGEYEVARFADGTIRWAFANSSPGWNWISSGFTAPLNQWSHVAVVYNSGVVSTYGNGTLAQTYNGSGRIGNVNAGTNDFRIGGRQIGSQYFQGFIDEVSIYNTALSSNQIAAIYSAGTDGKCAIENVPFGFDGTSDALLWSSNGLQLTLNGLDGQGAVIIYASTNLLTWTPIYTNPPATGTIQFLDTTATNHAMRFYRAVEQ